MPCSALASNRRRCHTARPTSQSHSGLRTHLQHLKLAQALLYQLLYGSLVCYVLVVAKRIARSPLCVLAEIVGSELVTLAQQRPILYTADVSSCFGYHKTAVFRTRTIDRVVVSRFTVSDIGARRQCCTTAAVTRGCFRNNRGADTYKGAHLVRHIAFCCLC